MDTLEVVDPLMDSLVATVTQQSWVRDVIKTKLKPSTVRGVTSMMAEV